MLNKILYLIAFIEGGSLMAVELFGAKLINPFFGTSPYVWAAVLAVTLLGLAFGYLFGGIVSKKANIHRILAIILVVSSGLVFLLPFISSKALVSLIQFPFEIGVIFSALIVLALPLFLFGMVSPIIIQLINSSDQLAGRNAGSVYAISTLGGILFTFVFGFYFIPYFGVKSSTGIVGSLLLLAALLSLVSTRAKQQFSIKA